MLLFVWLWHHVGTKPSPELATPPGCPVAMTRIRGGAPLTPTGRSRCQPREDADDGRSRDPGPHGRHSPLHSNCPPAFLMIVEHAALQQVPLVDCTWVVIAFGRKFVLVPMGRFAPLPLSNNFDLPAAPLFTSSPVMPSGVPSLSPYFHPFGEVAEPSRFQQGFPTQVPPDGAAASKSKLGVPVVSNTQSA